MRPPLLFRDARAPLPQHPAVRAGPAPRSEAGQALAQRIPPLWARVYSQELDLLGVDLGAPSQGNLFLDRWLATVTKVVEDRKRWLEKRDQLARWAGLAPGPRKTALTAYVERSVASWRERQKDLWALRYRDLDADALSERVIQRVEEQGVLLECLALLLAVPDPLLPADHGAWKWLHALVGEEPRAGTRRAAARAGLVQLSGLPRIEWQTIQVQLSETMLGRLDAPSSDPILARTAVQLLPAMGADGLSRLEALLIPGEDPDHFLVRAMAVEVLIHWKGPAAVEVALQDPSDTVRMACLAALSRTGDLQAHRLLVRASREDPKEEVRAEATLLMAGLSIENPFLLESACERLSGSTMIARRAADELGEAWAGQTPPPVLLEALKKARDGADPILGDRAAYALERLQAPMVAERLTALEPGESTEVRLEEEGVEELARGLAPFAVEGTGYALRQRGNRVEVYRGEKRVVRFWRLLYELSHPSPSKRQGVSHLLGREVPGTILVPPYRMTEATPTAVPGQRVFSPVYWGWAPYLPLVEDFLDSLQKGMIRIVTARGVTELHPPSSIFRRVRNWFHLSIHFHRYDQLRQASLASTDATERRRFTAAFEELGYHLHFRPHGVSKQEGTPIAPPIAELLSAGTGLLLLLVNPYRNTHGELSLLLLLTTLFALYSAWGTRTRIGSQRSAIPLVLGGWGTRGKSGSERLKASVFEGLGMAVFSKTTGCEAMVLHGPAGAHAQEIFLFRPMDTATIWENAHTLQLAYRMRAKVYLWECMALNARYVDLLQRVWLRDDASTLTNSYPDHEDIQGPTGLDVSESISGFTPERALLVTTEEHMVPVIAARARERHTALVHVQHGEGQRIPADLRARLPYQEHPRNMAMVATLAAQLGVDPLDAVILMGDHVVPDLGALMVVAPVLYCGRWIRFINGHSANDLASFTNCWRFTGLASHSAEKEPGRWVVLVVNNRHDRVARSRVFARIVVKEAPAHRHVIIGSNLEGFRQYVEDALADHLPTLTVGTGGEVRPRMWRQLESLKVVSPGALARAILRNFGQDPEAVADFVRACGELKGDATDLAAARGLARAGVAGAATALATLVAGGANLRDEVEREAVRKELPEHLVETAARWLRVQQVANTLGDGGPAADAIFRNLWAELLRANIHYLQDFHATGDQVAHFVAGVAPPGVQADVLGSQNIKGTGLQWVYGWVNLIALQKMVRKLGDPSAAVRAETIRAVQHFEGWCLISALWAREEVKRYPDTHALVRRLDEEVQRRRVGTTSTTQSGLMDTTLNWIERFLEPMDAIRRRHEADQIFEDLCNQRISHPRAALRLRELTERQKGGWLRKSYRKRKS